MVSVIIPCHNAGPLVREAIESVDWKDTEVIVIDDGSTDGCCDSLNARVVRTENRGASTARNTGLHSSSGEFVQFLDADDLLAEGKLQRQVDVLKRSGGDVAYGDWQRLVPEDGGYVPGEVVVNGPIFEPDVEIVSGVWRPTSAYLHRRTALEQIGGWREDLRHGEDERLAQDLALSGAKFVYTLGTMTLIRSTPGSLSRREPAAGYRVYRQNALAAEEFWKAQGLFTGRRREAVLARFAHIARNSRDRDEETYLAVLRDIERLGGRTYN